LASWEAAYRTVGWRAWKFPAPSHVLDAALSLVHVNTAFGDPVGPGWPWGVPGTRLEPGLPLLQGILVSAVRLAGGFTISVLAGMAIGLAMWASKWVDALLGPLFLGLQTLPSVCWVPLAVLAIGINEGAILFVLVMGSTFAVALAFRDGLRTIPPLYQRAGLMLGASGWKLFRYVLLPASMPALSSSLRQGFSFAWRSLLGAEFIFVVERRGLGFLLQAGRDFNDVARVIAVMAVMVGLGMVADRLVFARLEHRVYLRFGLQTN
jgi:NitT/TauT family transport system permease protein